MRGRNHDPGAEQPAEEALGAEGDVVRQVARPVGPVARQVLGELGRELGVRDDGETADSQVVGIVGAGAGNLNPAVVTVTIRAAGQGSTLVVRGAAKEGLIKQHAGGKAARRVAEALADTGGTHA